MQSGRPRGRPLPFFACLWYDENKPYPTERRSFYDRLAHTCGRAGVVRRVVHPCGPVQTGGGAGAAPTPVAVDTEGAAQRLAQLVRIPTVSNYDAEKFDETQFEGFREKLRELYPRVHAMCPPVRIAHTGMLFHWKGKSSAAPVVLMAHYDVVPVDEAGWKHPPFCGEVFDGELWGRGTLDTKITLLGILEAAERLMSEGFVPRNDVYFLSQATRKWSGRAHRPSWNI